jgi:hypothetical protein
MLSDENNKRFALSADIVSRMETFLIYPNKQKLTPKKQMLLPWIWEKPILTTPFFS